MLDDGNLEFWEGNSQKIYWAFIIYYMSSITSSPEDDLSIYKQQTSKTKSLCQFKYGNCSQESEYII